MQIFLHKKKLVGSPRIIFFRVLIGNFISNLNDRAMFIYLIWVVTKSQSLLLLNLFICFSLFPHILLFIPANRIINKVGAIRACLFSDGIKFFIYIAASISYIFYRNIEFLGLLLLSFLSNIGSAFFNPAAMSVPTFLSKVPMRKQKMIALLTFSVSLSTMLGPLLAMWFFYLSLDHTIIIFVFASIMYLISSFNNMGLRLDRGIIGAKNLSASNVRILYYYPDIVWLLISFLMVNLVFMPIQIFIPLIVKAKFLQMDGYTLSLLEASIGFGAIVGISSLLFISKSHSNYLQLFQSFLIAGCGYVAFSFSETILEITISLFVLGIFLAVGNVLTINYYQQRAKINSHVVMIMGVVNLISVSVGPIAMAISGIIISSVGLPLALRVYAISMVVLSLGLLLTKFFQFKE